MFIPNSAANSSTASDFSRTLTSSTTTAGLSLCSATSSGISARQGPHQVAQKLITTGFPCNEARSDPRAVGQEEGEVGRGIADSCIALCDAVGNREAGAQPVRKLV